MFGMEFELQMKTETYFLNFSHPILTMPKFSLIYRNKQVQIFIIYDDITYRIYLTLYTVHGFRLRGYRARFWQIS